nr:hypothetical protein [Klebsiella pneumoniae subsp. pneumoniae]
MLYGTPVELTIVEDDNPRCVRRWSGGRLFMKRSSRRRRSHIADNNIQTRVVSSTPIWMKSIRPI